MANKRLFVDLPLGTPTNDKKIVYGDAAGSNNITLGDFKSWLGLSTGAIKSYVVEIGGWNMNTDSVKLFIPIPLPPQPGQIFSNYPTLLNIRGIKVMIRNDAGTVISDFLSVQNGTDINAPLIQISEFTFIFYSVTVSLQRKNGSFYATSADYNDGGINRGWLLIDYVE